MAHAIAVALGGAERQRPDVLELARAFTITADSKAHDTPGMEQADRVAQAPQLISSNVIYKANCAAD